MKIQRALLASLLLVLSPLALADYELGPPETYLASVELVVIDATIREINDKGFVELETHELIVGKAAPRALQHISLNCKGLTPASSTGMAKGKRYIFVVSGSDLLEWSTYWEVVRSFDGELKCYYSGVEDARRGTKVTMPRSGLHSLAYFKKQIKAVAFAAQNQPEKRAALRPAPEEDEDEPKDKTEAQIATPSDLAKRNAELTNKLGHAKHTLRQVNMKLLSYLSQHLDGTPLNKPMRQDAVRMAVKMAPLERGNPLVWRVLHQTKVLRDGMSREAAERLLGPPTTAEGESIEWYFNPGGRHVAPYLRATVKEGSLANWKRGNR